MSRDEDHLRLLTIFHYIVAGIAGLTSLVPMVYLGMGVYLILSTEKSASAGPVPPTFMGWVFVGIGAVMMVLGWIYSILVFVAGRCLADRRRYQFCLVMGGVECLFFPFGAVLGAFTILVLIRPSVKRFFEMPSHDRPGKLSS